MKKLKLIHSFGDIFSIKIGDIKKLDNKCYKVSRYIEVIFKIYYSAPVFFIIMLMFFMQPHYFNSLIMQIVETFILYVLIEFIVLFILPINEVSCWEKNLQERE